jgi:hypothetical protein
MTSLEEKERKEGVYLRTLRKRQILYKIVKKLFKNDDLDIEFKIDNFVELSLNIKLQIHPNKYVDNGVYQCAHDVQKIRPF